MAVLDHFFCKIYFFVGMTEDGFFLGHVGHFFGPWDRFSKNGGISQKGGGILCFGVFSNVILREKLAVKYKDK